jgi:nucleoside transporter
MKLRLSVMMFLQYAIWGAWLPILFSYLGHLGFDGNQCFQIFAAGAAGAVAGPFIAGQIADRFFATERFLGISHLLGAILVWNLAETTSFTTFLALSALYGLIYAPTLALTNSICFHHLPDRDRDFGRVRLWGTIGWIVAGIAVGHWLARFTPVGDGVTDAMKKAAWDAHRNDAFKLSAILGVVLGLFSFELPHTPPKRDVASGQTALGKALSYCFRAPLLLLFLLAIPMSCVHQFYFVHASNYLSVYQARGEGVESFTRSINSLLGVGGGGLMTIGQMSEIAVLALVTVLAKKMSRKALLAIGLTAYAARMALFTYTDSLPTALLGVALHGFCFGCFIFVAFMVVDEETPSDVRATAQNLFNVVIVGIGIVVGSWFAAQIVDPWAKSKIGLGDGIAFDAIPAAQKHDYFAALFSIPMWISLGCLLVLLLAYPARRTAPAAAMSEVPA